MFLMCISSLRFKPHIQFNIWGLHLPKPQPLNQRKGMNHTLIVTPHLGGISWNVTFKESQSQITTNDL